MTKADWLILAGFSSFGSGLYFIYKPLPLMFAGMVFLVLARAVSSPKKAKAE